MSPDDIKALVAARAPDHAGHIQEERPHVREAIDLHCSCGVALSFTEEAAAVSDPPPFPRRKPRQDDRGD